MRKLMWFVIGFTAACALASYVLDGIWLLLLALGFLTFAGISLCFSSSKGKIIAVMLLGCTIGMIWQFGFSHIYLSNAKRIDGEEMILTVTASDYAYSQQYGELVDGHIQLDGKRYPVRVYLDDTYEITPGNCIDGTFSVRYVGADNTSKNTYHQSKGIFLLLYEEEITAVTKAEISRLRDYPAVFRQKILTAITEVFPADCIGFAKALLLGETDGLTYEQDRAFQVSGIRHVVAVSGLHVSILFSLLYLFVGRNRWLVALLGIPMLALFAAVAGFTPSVVRACLMQLLICLAGLTQKEYDPPTALSFSVLVLLAVNPFVITAVGFQLSVGCMIGIFLFAEKLRQYLLSVLKWQEKGKGKSIRARLMRWTTGSVSVTLSAMVFTVPLCAAYFGMVSLVGILANLLCLWVISFVFYGIILTCLLSGIWFGGAQSVAWIIAWPIRYVFAVSRLLSRFPLAAVYTDSVYIIVWLVFSYVLLISFLLLKRKHPIIATSGILVGLAVCVTLSWLEPRLYGTQISVIDVGQGQSILLKSDDAYYLVDCGSDKADAAADTVANYLLSQGVTQLDGLILTHYDTDHAGSALQLLSSVPAVKIYMPDTQDANGLRSVIESDYAEQVELISNTQKLNISGGEITFYPSNSAVSDNESSMCVLFQRENCAILITGDRSSQGERMLLAEVDLPSVNVLVVGHHGSRNATSFELLHTIRPAIAVISVSDDNLYGHPHAEVLERLQMYGCSIFRTDQQGTITFRR